jgi:hypothetical protein
VHHARKAHIFNVCRATGHFARDVDALDRVPHYRVLLRVLRCRLRRRHNVQSLAGNEFSSGLGLGKTVAINAWENSRPIAAPIWATSLADPSRSSRAISDA